MFGSFFLGIVILAIVAGKTFSQPLGWAVLGVGLIIIGLMEYLEGRGK